MLRGDVAIERAVVVGEGPLADPLVRALRAASFCGEVSAQPVIADLDATDLVIIDAPGAQTAELVRKAIAHASPGTLITELCPVKSRLLDRLEAEIPSGYGFVACTIFPAPDAPIVGATVTISPMMGSVPAALERMRRIWEQLGAGRVLQVDPSTQDLWIAARQIASAAAKDVATEAAGEDALGGDPAGIGAQDMRTMNRDHVTWLEERMPQARPERP